MLARCSPPRGWRWNPARHTQRRTFLANISVARLQGTQSVASSFGAPGTHNVPGVSARVALPRVSQSQKWHRSAGINEALPSAHAMHDLWSPVGSLPIGQNKHADSVREYMLRGHLSQCLLPSAGPCPAGQWRQLVPSPKRSPRQRSHVTERSR